MSEIHWLRPCRCSSLRTMKCPRAMSRKWPLKIVLISAPVATAQRWGWLALSPFTTMRIAS